MFYYSTIQKHLQPNTSSRIKRINWNFILVLLMRTSIWGEELGLVMFSNVAIKQWAYTRRLPNIDRDKNLILRS